jgi:hypothetical protein
MGLIRLIVAPIRSIVRFPLFQLAAVVAIILFLQAANDQSVYGRLFDGLDAVVSATVGLSADLFQVKSFTRSGLTAGLMIGYVYLVCLLILFVLRLLIRGLIDLVGWSNAFGLRNTIARERGIAAYRAWLPLERIRPTHVPQPQWEEAFAWPAGDRPPYPPLMTRLMRGALSYLIVIAGAVALIQIFTPFPIGTWLGKFVKTLTG